MEPRWRTPRYSATAGISAVALWVAGVVIAGGGHLGLPGGLPEEPADAVLAFYQSNLDRISLGAWLFMLGSVAFTCFAVSLAREITDREGSSLQALASVTGATTGVLTLGMASGGLVAVLGVDSLEAATAQALNAVEAVFFIAAEMSAAVYCASIGVLALRANTLPRWWAVLTLVLAGWLFLLPIGWIGLLVGIPVWVLSGSLLQLARRQAPTTSTPSPLPSV